MIITITSHQLLLGSTRKMLTSRLSLLWLSIPRLRPPFRKNPLGPIPQPNSMNPLVAWLPTFPLSVFTTFRHSSPQGQQMAIGNS